MGRVMSEIEEERISSRQSNINLFFYSKHCPFCKKVWKALSLTNLNAKLEPHRRVKPVDVHEDKRIFNRYRGLIEGTPAVILDNVIYAGATSVGFYKGVFEAHFKNEVLSW